MAIRYSFEVPSYPGYTLEVEFTPSVFIAHWINPDGKETDCREFPLTPAPIVALPANDLKAAQ